MPVAFGGNQFKNWLQPYGFASQNQHSSPVAHLPIRLEPISMPNAGGIWRQPVQKLVATIWFCIAKPALESCCPPTDKTRTHFNAKCRWHLAATSSKLNCNHLVLLRKTNNRVPPPDHIDNVLGLFSGGGVIACRFGVSTLCFSSCSSQISPTSSSRISSIVTIPSVPPKSSTTISSCLKPGCASSHGVYPCRKDAALQEAAPHCNLFYPQHPVADADVRLDVCCPPFPYKNRPGLWEQLRAERKGSGG